MNSDANKDNNDNNDKLKKIVLSTNVNDYDTGEPVIEGSIRKTINRNQKDSC
jgi:hypothetical protein